MNRDEILAKVRERIQAYATSRVSGEVAEDLAQDVLIILHEKYPHVTELAELLPLSFQVVRFKMLEVFRKAARRGESRQVPIEDLPLADAGDNPEAEAIRKQRVERIAEALSQLGTRCRELFRWKLDGKTFPQIQILMGQHSINTIYTWDHRCRKQLLALLGGSWETT